jgi:AcrR family transcriptional regulator
MPQTRTDTSREAKQAEIVELAQARLRSDGYAGLSMAAIARELGVAQNAVYWYFPSKDHLFVAAMEGMLTEIAARKPKHRDADEIERILWFTDQFSELSSLRAAMAERAPKSEVVAEFASRLDSVLSRMLANTLSDRIDPGDLPLAVETFRATVEGTVVKGLSRRRRRQVLDFALRRMVRDGSSVTPT